MDDAATMMPTLTLSDNPVDEEVSTVLAVWDALMVDFDAEEVDVAVSVVISVVKVLALKAIQRYQTVGAAPGCDEAW